MLAGQDSTQKPKYSSDVELCSRMLSAASLLQRLQRKEKGEAKLCFMKEMTHHAVATSADEQVETSGFVEHGIQICAVVEGKLAPVQPSVHTEPPRARK